MGKLLEKEFTRPKEGDRHCILLLSGQPAREMPHEGKDENTGCNQNGQGPDRSGRKPCEGEESGQDDEEPEQDNPAEAACIAADDPEEVSQWSWEDLRSDNDTGSSMTDREHYDDDDQYGFSMLAIDDDPCPIDEPKETKDCCTQTEEALENETQGTRIIWCTPSRYNNDWGYWTTHNGNFHEGGTNCLTRRHGERTTRKQRPLAKGTKATRTSGTGELRPLVKGTKVIRTTEGKNRVKKIAI